VAEEQHGGHHADFLLVSKEGADGEGGLVARRCLKEAQEEKPPQTLSFEELMALQAGHAT
jgi:hypothetical protein